MTVTGWIEIGALAIIFAGLWGVYRHRMKTGPQLVQSGDSGRTVKVGRGTGARTVQLVVAILTIPTILILSLENRLPSDAVSALLGTIIGYVLSGVGLFQPKREDGKD